MPAAPATGGMPRMGRLHSTPNGGMMGAGPAWAPGMGDTAAARAQRCVETPKTYRHGHRGDADGLEGIRPAVDHL